jgi:hypothetical protein
VTKFAESDQVRSLVELGHRDFGENRVQHLIQQAAMVEEFLAPRPHAPRGRQGLQRAGPLAHDWASPAQQGPQGC